MTAACFSYNWQWPSRYVKISILVLQRGFFFLQASSLDTFQLVGCTSTAHVLRIFSFDTGCL